MLFFYVVLSDINIPRPYFFHSITEAQKKINVSFIYWKLQLHLNLSYGNSMCAFVYGLIVNCSSSVRCITLRNILHLDWLGYCFVDFSTRTVIHSPLGDWGLKQISRGTSIIRGCITSPFNCKLTLSYIFYLKYAFKKFYVLFLLCLLQLMFNYVFLLSLNNQTKQL